MAQELFFKIVVIIGPLILAISVHEFCHIAAARWLGDDLGTRLGRFTLDPLKHIDPLWTVGLPMMLLVMSTLRGGAAIPVFAAGKPAPYNPTGLTRKFNGKRINLRTAELLIAIAGPLSNLFLAFVSLVVVYFLISSGNADQSQFSVMGLVVQFMYLNLALFVFNLIPIHPLDGGKVLVAFLPYKAAQKFDEVSHRLGWMLLALMIFGGGAFIGTAVYGLAELMFKLIV